MSIRPHMAASLLVYAYHFIKEIMKNIENLLTLNLQYGNEIRTENLVAPLSDRAWQFLAELQEQAGMSLPALIERLLDDACAGEWWTEWAECNEAITWH